MTMPKTTGQAFPAGRVRVRHRPSHGPAVHALVRGRELGPVAGDPQSGVLPADDEALERHIR